jgi:ABC-2 type transport system ATP-binding protein
MDSNKKIDIQSLKKYYGEKLVLDIPELSFYAGESIGLVGNNGAGKTTLFSLLLDLIHPSEGQVLLGGEVVHKSEAWKPFTSSFLDESFLISYLTPEEYFYFIADLRQASKAEVDALLEEHKGFFNDEVLGQKKYLRDFSKGNQKKVGIIATLIGNPELIILDEPFANLDPSTQIRLKRIMKSLAADPRITLLVSSHDLQHTVEVSDRIVVLQKGQVVKDLKTSPETLEELENFFTS